MAERIDPKELSERTGVSEKQADDIQKVVEELLKDRLAAIEDVLEQPGVRRIRRA